MAAPVVALFRNITSYSAFEDGHTYWVLFEGLARTICIRCVYGICGRESNKYTVMYGVYKQFWPALHIQPGTAASSSPLISSLRLQASSAGRPLSAGPCPRPGSTGRPTSTLRGSDPSPMTRREGERPRAYTCYIVSFLSGTHAPPACACECSAAAACEGVHAYVCACFCSAPVSW